MGVVYQAEQEEFGGHVALEVLADDPRFTPGFTREWRVWLVCVIPTC
jgi:hypothetical protein